MIHSILIVEKKINHFKKTAASSFLVAQFEHQGFKLWEAHSPLVLEQVIIQTNIIEHRLDLFSRNISIPIDIHFLKDILDVFFVDDLAHSHGSQKEFRVFQKPILISVQFLEDLIHVNFCIFFRNRVRI